MKNVALIAAAIVLGFGLLAQVRAQSDNLLLELVMVGMPQTQVVRDLKDRSKYYLCWTDGTNRYGVKFSRRSVETQLNRMRPGGRTSLSSVVSLDTGGWSPADDAICWGKEA